MKEEKVYGVLNWVLLPFTILLVIFLLFAIVAGMLNPTLFLVALILASVLYYTYSSVQFFRKNIKYDIPAKPSKRSWITYTGFMALLFIFNIIFSCVQTLSNKTILMQSSQNMLDAMQPQLEQLQKINYDTSFLNVQTLYNASIIINVGFLIYGLVLLLHVMMSFKFLKKYRHLFG